MGGARRAGRSPLWRVLGWVAMVVLLLVVLVPVGALTFSVKVSGRSMAPTLAEGDRLLMDVLHRDEIRRFDLVEASFGQGAFRVVKRVVGLPGDQIRIDLVGGKTPRISLRPEGSSRTFAVENPVWDDQVGAAANVCCDPVGQLSERAQWQTIPKDRFWLLGDNWGGSDDSRKLGFVVAEDIGARLNFRLLPLGRSGRIHQPARLIPLS